MKGPTLDALTAKLETIQQRSPADFAALDVVVDLVLRRLKEEAVARGVTNRLLLSRLQARHDCKQPDGGGFEQIEPEYGYKRWRCAGCGVIVILD